MPNTREILRVANCSGFYGDRLSAAREMVEGGPIDVLTGDYLAELTMAIVTDNTARTASIGATTGSPIGGSADSGCETSTTVV